MDDQTVYLTVCDENTRIWQVPLLITSTIMIFFLALSCGATYILHRILDPIKTMKMSKCCFPCLDSIWPQDQNQKPLHGPILHFVLNPSQKTFSESNQKLKTKTGYDMIHWSIKYGYSELIQTILTLDIGEGVNLDLVKKALMEGDCKVIKMILDAAERHEGDTDIDKEGLLAVKKQLPYNRGMLISYKGTSLSMSSSILNTVKLKVVAHLS